MATYARPGAMPHHHVPEPKETSPVVGRLRLELNRTVRRRVTEAVDTVCVAFENDLTQLTHTAFPRVVGVDNFELFHDCCSRLMQFIDRNMSTTSGFLEQMDRLILACHSGATGSALNSVMTKDLWIRWQDKTGKHKSSNNQVGVQAELSNQPAISPGNTAISRKGDEKVASGEEVGVTATVGITTRQWGKRNRLSTKNRSSTRQLRSKRLKRSLTPEWGPSTYESEEEEKKREGSDEEDKNKGSDRLSSRQVRALKLTSRRVKSIHRFGSAPENEKDVDVQDDQQPHAAKTVERKGVDETERERRTRWHLRSSGKTVDDSNDAMDVNKGNPVELRICEKTQAQPNEGLLALEVTGMTEVNHAVGMMEPSASSTEPACIEATKSKPVPEQEQRPVSTASGQQFLGAELNTGAKKATDYLHLSNSDTEVGKMSNDCGETGLPVERDAVIPSNGVDLSEASYEEEENGTHCSSSVNNLNPSHQAVVSILPNDDSEPDAGDSRSDGVQSISTATPKFQDTRGLSEKNLDRKTQLQDGRCSSQNAADFLSNQIDDNIRECADTHIAEETETQEEAAAIAQEDASSESDHELPVPGLCDAGMRPPQQVSRFKACLRKSIQFVDVVLCKPPPGKTCSRHCEKVRARQCREGVPCRDPLCRNWHKAEAHTERCKNPLCEFRNRILLREIRHQIVSQNLKTQLLLSQQEEKNTELIVATTSTNGEQYTLELLTQLSEDIGQLERSIDDAKEETESLKNTRRALLANLSAIGVKDQDDVRDGFPDFETHYK